MSAVLPPGVTLIPASAGTGKTFRIVDIVRNMVVEEGVDLRRIVVCTFTEAAAGELRARIRKRISDARDGLLARIHDTPWNWPDVVLEQWVTGQANEDLEVKVERAWQALVHFDEACIGTIHSFCNRVLIEASFECGAPFHSEMLANKNSVVDAVVRDFWVRHTHRVSPATLASLEALGISQKLLRDLAQKASDPTLLVAPDSSSQPVPIDLTTWSSIVSRLHAIWSADEPQIRDLLLNSRELVRRRNTAKGLLHSLPRVGTTRFLDAVPDWLDGTPVPGKPLPDWVLALRGEGVAAATVPNGTPPTHAFFDELDVLHTEHTQLAAPLAAWRLSLQHELVNDTRRRLAQQLRKRNARTFDSLLRDVRDPALDAGRGAWVKQTVRARYDAAIVDEFQDTNPVQWDIFRQLFGDRLLLVGDPKQSIYRFRGADFETYRRASEAAERPAESLEVNFRTDALLLEAIEHVFSRPAVMAPMFDPRIDFPSIKAKHREPRLRNDQRPPLHFRFLSRSGMGLNKGFLKKSEYENKLANIVANDVVEELKRQGAQVRNQNGDWEDITPRHCAVLTRSNVQAQNVARALKLRGVPATVRSDASVLDSEEQTQLVHVLRAVHDPMQTRLVRRALLTDVLGFSAAQVVDLSQDERWMEVAGRFRRWNSLWHAKGILPMMRALLDEGQVADRYLGSGRERELTNLRHLAELMQRVARERRFTPGALLAWLEQGGPGLGDGEADLRLDTDTEAVTVVTVHSAKGLEYPLVWIPWLHRGNFVGTEDKAHLLVQDPQHPTERRIDLGSADYPTLLAKVKRDNISEDMRLAYVALTRAKHRCVVYWGASHKNPALAWLLLQQEWMSNPKYEEKWGTTDARQNHIWNRHKSFYEQKEENHPKALRELAKHPGIDWDIVDWGSANGTPHYEPTTLPVGALHQAATNRTRALDLWWRKSSFTSMARSIASEEPKPHVDHDSDTLDVEDDMSSDDPVPTADIPGSARLGTFIHQVLEHHTLSGDKAALEGLIEQGLARHNLPKDWCATLTSGLHAALDAPVLPEGLKLNQLQADHCWDELEFHLPMAGGFEPDGKVEAASLAEVFASNGGGPGLPGGWATHVQGLQFLPARGFLYGSIDLVFRHNGRWFLADWKSNRLGTDWSAYRTDRLGDAMLHAHYPLQYHLYTVGLVRMLRQRVKGFDYECDFGGCLYLFLRGMAPERPDHGVFFDRPPEQLVAALDRLFEEGS